jgi:hypothetical protein
LYVGKVKFEHRKYPREFAFTAALGQKKYIQKQKGSDLIPLWNHYVALERGQVWTNKIPKQKVKFTGTVII